MHIPNLLHLKMHKDKFFSYDKKTRCALYKEFLFIIGHTQFYTL